MRRYLLLVLLILLNYLGYTQVATQAIDLSASPNSQVTIKGLDRNGIACKESDLNQQCVVFNITINPDADILNFEVANPAPSGAAANYRLNCEDTLRRLGPPICVLGQTSLTISFCKKGNDNAHYIFTTSQLVKASDDLTLRVGCSGTMSVTGLTAASTKWTSVYPGTRGTYDSFLAPATGALSTTVTPGNSAPINGYIDYEVSGNVASTSCTNYPRTDTVRVYVVPTFDVTTTPGAPALCSNSTSGIVLAATPSGGKPPYVYKWSNGQATSSITVSSPGDYTVTVYDKTPDCLPVTKTMTVASVAAPLAPAFSGQTICYNQSATITPPTVAGTYTYYDVASGGTALFSGNETQPFVTPGLTAGKTYYVEYTLSCTSPRTAVTITVEPKVDPAFVYPNGGTYCNAATNPSPTMMGGISGTFSANPNTLAINPTTGEIDLSSSPDTTYTVTFVTSGVCAYTSTATITITNSPNAEFTYPNSPYCQTDANPTPLFTNGGSSGTFTVTPAGLTFANNSTGEIDLKNSIPNTYTVTNTISSGSCGTATANAVIIINAAPVVSAGLDQIVCAGQLVQLNGSHTGASTVTWSAPSGSGSFLNANDPNTTFTPASNVSSITLTLTTDDPSGPCTAQSDQVTITISPSPEITSAEKDTICNNETLPYSITSDIVGTTFTWSRASVPGISNPPITNQNSSLISESLINSSNVPIEVVYEITPKTATCTGPLFNYKVVVNPTPQITSSAKDFICSGIPIGYQIQSNIASGVTYKWTRIDTPDITPSSNGEQQGDFINETLRNSSNTPVDVSYLITPFYGSCQGTPFTYTAVIKPTPYITSASSAEICSKDSVSYKITGSVNGTTFTWKREAISGINNGDLVLSHISNDIREILENSSTTPIEVVYEITPFYDGCTGDMFTYVVTVNPTVIAPSASGQSICSGTSTSITASGSTGTYAWFDVASGGTSLASTATFTTGVLTADKTFYVETTVNGCTSARTAVNVIIISIPAAPIAADQSICSGTSTSITASGSSGTYAWFDVASGGTALASTATFNTGVLTADKTYYVETTVNGCTSARTAVNVNIIPIPAAPSATDQSICSGTSASITASGSAGTYAWFDVASGGVPIASTATLTTGVLTADKTYYVETTVNGCTSTRTAVNVTIKPIPAAPSAADQSICSGTSTSINASGSSGTYAWFDVASGGGVPIATTATLNTGVLTADKTYYVETTVNGCTSARTAVNVTIIPIPAAPSAADQSICSGTSTSITASGSTGTYAWFDVASGGTALASTATFNTGVLTADKSYYVETTVNGCTSARTAVNVTIKPIPAAPIAADQSICSGTSASITASGSAGTYAWFDVASGGTALASTATLNTGVLTADKTYYVETTVNGCTSARTAVNVTIKPIPAAPSAADQSICSGTSTSITASGSAGTYAWFDGASGGTPISTTATLTTGVLTADKTYYVETTVNGCTSARTAVNVTIIPIPAAPSAADQSICSGTSASITASGSTGTYAWFDVASGGIALTSTATLNTGVLTADKTYYVETTVNGCTSARTAVNVAIKPIPAAPSAADQSICSGTSASITASGSAGTYAWFDGASGGTPISTTATLTTGVLTADKTYYVETTVNGCTSARTAVNVTIKPIPAAPSAADQSICSGTSTSITANGSAGTYAWFDVASGGVPIATTATLTTGVLTADKTYYVETTVNGCTSARTAVNITIKPIPAAPIAADQSICSGTSTSINASGSSGTYAWFDVASGGTALASTATLNTGVLTADKTYYVETTVNGCTSARTAVNVTIIPIPAAPIAADQSICSGTSTSITASGSTGTYAWFDVASGGTALASTATLTTGVLTADKTYYVETTVNGCTSARTAVNVTIISIPAAPSAADQSICSGTSTYITASGSAGTYAWFDVASGGTALASTATLNTGVLTADKTYYVETTVNGCTSARTAVNVTIKPIPGNPAASAPAVCEGSTANFAINSPVSGVTYEWFAALSGGAAISTGDTFTVNGLGAGNHTYYVQASQNGCTSGRTSVTVTVNKIPNAPITTNSISTCQGSEESLTVTSPVNGETYEWLSSDGVILSTGTTFKVSPALSTTYYVQSTLNNCTSSRTSVLVTVNPIPQKPEIKTNSPICAGTDLQLRTSALYATAEYIWTGPNNFISSQQNPVITNATTAASGVYTLAVKVNGCISETETVNVLVGAIPTVTKVTADTICIQSSGRLEAFGPAGNYNWYRTVTGGLPVGGGSVFNTPLLDSTTTYYVDVTSAADCISARVPVTALVLYPENPAFKYPTGTYCITSPANPKPDIYAKGGGTFSVNNPALKFVSTTTGEINLAATVPGKYLITFTANNSCAYISTAEITITDKPSAKFVYLNAGQFCQSDINPTPSFPNGGSAGVFTVDNSGLIFINNTTGEINLRASKPGSYILKNTISGGGCLPDSAFYSVRIYEAPTVEAGTDQTICSTEKVTLTGSFGGSATGVIWSAPSGTFSNVNDPHAVYTPAPGANLVRLTLTTFDPTGPCSAISDTLILTIKQTPVITCAASDSVCNNQTLNYRITTSVPNALTTWSRDAVAGVFNDAVTQRIGDVINETIVNTTNTVQKVVYRIQASNANCETELFTYTVFVKPSAVITNTSLYQSLCSGSKNQAVTWLGFAPGTTFVWSATAPASITGYLANGTGNLAEQTLMNTGTAPASITYTVTPYFKGCAGTPVNYTITVNPIPSAPTISSNSPICIGNTLQLQTQSSYPGAEYFWTGPNNFSSNLQNPTIPSITASGAGDYHLILKVNNCISSVSTLSVQVEGNPAAPNVTPVSICINTSARLEASGPTGTYNWYTSASGGNPIATGKIYNTPLLDSTRTYYVDVTSSAGCTGPRQAVTATVLYPENPAFKYSSGTYCRTAGFHPIPVLTGNSGGTFSSSVGLAIVNAATGEIDPAASTPGTYTVKFVANVSCQYESFADITITDDPKPVFSYESNYCQKDTNPTPVFPAGNSGGVFSVNKPGLVFVNTSTGEINLSKSAPGTYTITNTISGGGCATVSATFDLSIFEAPIVDAGTVGALCPNEKAVLHGSISGGASKGVWSAPSGSFSNVNDLDVVYTPAPGVNSVVLTLTSTDPAGPCTAVSDTVTVRINPVLVVTSSASDSVCNNQNLNYRITNTAPGAIIKWSRAKVTGISNSAVTDSIGDFIDEVLINTTNSVQRVIYNISASNNCEARTHTYIVYVKPATRITNTSLNQELCSGSQTQRVTFSSSITGTTYGWTATAPDFVTGYSASGQDAIHEQTINNNGTAPASVIYTVTPYYQGCPGIPVLYTVVVKPKPQVSGVNSSVVCSNEAQAYIIESPIAGTSFNWTRPSVTGISNPAGSGTGSKITEALINITSSPVKVKYFITPIYQGCTGQEFEYSVTVKATPVIKISSLTKEICSGETLEEIPLEANINGTTFNWTAAVSGSLNTIQAFGSGNIPGQTLLNTGNTTATITYKVNYSLQGCPGLEATYVVKVKPAIQTPAISSNSPVCKGIALQLSAANLANASYYWTGPDNFQSNLQNPVIPAAQVKNAGKYSLFVIVNGCASPVKEINVVVSEDPINVIASSNSPTCANSTIILKATHFEGAVYSWTGPNNFTSNTEQPEIANATPAMAGRYHVIVTAPGCSSTGSASTDIIIKPRPAPPVVVSQLQICSGEVLTLSANGSANGLYQWSGPDNFTSTQQNPKIPNVGAQHAGEYKVTVTVDGCTSTWASTTVKVNETAIAFAGGSRTVCASDSVVTLSGSLSGPAVSGTWRTTNGTGIFNPAETLITTYKLSKEDIRSGQVDIFLDPIVSAGNNCPATSAHVTLNVAPAPTVSAGEDQKVCSNKAEVSLSGSVTVASSAKWSSSGTGTFHPSSTDLNAVYRLSQSDIAAGNISLTLTSGNSNSCNPVTDKMNIEVITAPKVDAGRLVYLFKDEFVTLQPIVSGKELTYKWSPADFMDDDTSKNPKVKGVADRTYQLTVTGEGGCTESDEVRVIVLEPVNPPNTFTPNGDNKNDFWNIPQLAKYPDVKVSIFNRYGTKIFTANGYNTPWDGNYDGKPVPVGVYYYVIDISMFGKKLSGYITVLR